MGGYEGQLPNVGTSAVAAVQIAGTENDDDGPSKVNTSVPCTH
jgi:hypothetical protein